MSEPAESLHRDPLALRWLRERDEARHSGDRLARAVQAHLRGEQVDLAAALLAYGEADGPAFAVAPVEPQAVKR